MVELAIENRFLNEVYEALKANFRVRPDEIKDTPELGLKKGYKRDSPTWTFFSLITQKYKGITPATLKVVFKKPEVLLYHETLEVLSDQCPLI